VFVFEMKNYFLVVKNVNFAEFQELFAYFQLWDDTTTV